MSTMRPDRIPPIRCRAASGTARRFCRGFSAIAAVAILVILAVLGAFVVTVSGIQSHSSALDILGSRAFQAAKAGIEWGAYQVLNPENTNPPGGPFTTPYPCGAATNISGLGGGLGDFTVTVGCSMSGPYTEFGNTVRVYQITATSCNIPTGSACPNNSTTSPTYVERQITTVLSTCRQTTGASC